MGIKSNRKTESYYNYFADSGTDASRGEPNPLATPGMTASGGIISEYLSGGNAYRSHVFTSPGSFVISALGEGHKEIDYLIIGGGGGGGIDINQPSPGGASGGGGGGLKYTEGLSVTATGTYNVTVGRGFGGGGWWSNPTNSPYIQGFDGGPSTITNHPAGTITAPGGGGGGGYGANSPSPANGWNGNGTTIRLGKDGGSGGGTPGSPNYDEGATTGTTGHPGGIDIQSPPTSYWGNPGGGDAPTNTSKGSGGGGAAVAGTVSTPTAIGSGGDGARYTIATGTAEYYAGGGGGSSGGFGAGTDGAGGQGGGGRGAQQNPVGYAPGVYIGYSGTPGTGGGGGGLSAPAAGGQMFPADRGYNGTVGSAHCGGDGVCIIRYKVATAQQGGTAKATGGCISFYNSKTIHTFFRSGNFATPGDFSETCEYVVLAGGGSGGAGYAAGGGAGGYLTGTTPVVGSTNLTVTVGDGGKSAERCNNYVAGGDQGKPSSVNFPAGTIACTGGGFGGHNWQPTAPFLPGTASSKGGPGGSGGGACFPPGGGGSQVPGQGTQGGDGHNAGSYDNAGGGGGGKGSNGESGSSGNGGNGGEGVQLPATFRNPTANIGYPGPGGGGWWVAGGGGGGTRTGPGVRGQGGCGPTNVNPLPHGYCGAGHGAGSPHGPTEPVHADNALANSGSGGGGCGGGGSNDGADWNSPSGKGGSGLILIAYPT